MQAEILELRRESVLLSDKEQWFTEKLETIGRGKTKREALIGRVHWNQDFQDEDTGEVITIERCEVVRIDGEWK